MARHRLGTIRHRSFAYFLLLAAAGLSGLLLAMALKQLFAVVLLKVGGTEPWADIASSVHATIQIVVIWLALVSGRKLIWRFWTVVPDRDAD